MSISLSHLLLQNLLDLGSVVSVYVIWHETTGCVWQTVLILLLDDTAASTPVMLILRLLSSPLIFSVCSHCSSLVLLQRTLLALLVLIALWRNDATHREVAILLHVVAHGEILLVVTRSTRRLLV